MTHPLSAYIRETGDTIEAFARRIGVEADVVKRIADDREAPEPTLARRIADVTGGALSFEQLMEGRSAVVLDFQARRGADSALDLRRLSEAIARSLAALGPASAAIPMAAVHVAAEATDHTYAALARVTTRQGPARLAQALQPVLQGILEDFGGLPERAEQIADAANSASQFYFQSR
jgi:predicted phage gp36 major capsid-like protein